MKILIIIMVMVILITLILSIPIYKEDYYRNFFLYTFTFSFYPYTNILFYYFKNI